MFITSKYLLRVGVALVLVCAPCIGCVAETRRGIRQVRQPHHLLSHSVVSDPSPQAL